MHRFTARILLTYICITALSLVLFFSCQRELSPDSEPISQGVLLKDENGNCEQVLVNGNYNLSQTLSDSNYLEADVNVTSPGLFNISTDTINGYYFAAAGTFINAGLMHVKLFGAGAPVITGVDHFQIKYNETYCQAWVTVADTVLSAAIFTLEGAPGNCMNNTVYGSYVKNVLLDTNDKVKLTLNVTMAGSYNIETNTINGYSFSGSGILAKTGLQNIFLTASGKPLKEEVDVFTINTGESLCNFPVTVLTAVTVAGSDYYPLSEKNYWTYDDLVNVGDTIKESIIDSTNINNHFYKIMQEDFRFGGPYQYYYRKSGTDYFEYAAPNKYTTFFQYKKPVYADIPFLKENLAANFMWQSPEYIDTASNGDIISLKYNFMCLDADATVTVNEKAFTNVYKIKLHPFVKSDGGDYEYTNEEYLFYYAKGIGLIYLKKTLSGFIQKETQVKNWRIN